MTHPAHLFATFNAGVKAARDAYHADQLREASLCVVCEQPWTGMTRVCHHCRNRSNYLARRRR